MKTTPAMIAVAAVCAALALAPLSAGAHGFGSGVHAHGGLFGYVPRFQFHTPRPLRFRSEHHHHDVRPWQWPWYGGALVLPHEQPAFLTQPTQPVAVKSCRYLKQAVTVPAEAGGLAQVTVTRC
jgi:hypothetical protein